MMTLVDELSLAAISASIEPPRAAEEPRTAAAPAADRLAELSAWWELVSGPDAPQRAAHLWAPDDDGPATHAEVTPRPWEPPSAAIPEIIGWAVDSADAAIDAGADLVLLSVPVGSGASAPATLAASLLHLDAVDAAGWPSETGMSDLAWMDKVAAIRDGLQRLRSTDTSPPDAGTSPDELLRRLGDAALAAGCAVLLRCASRRTPVIFEGMGSAVCALLACRAGPASRAWSVAADGPAAARGAAIPPNLLHDRVLETLAHDPLTRLGLSWADGTGARIVLSLLETAMHRNVQ